MATTSKALAQGTAPAGRGGKHLGRWLALLAAAAALGLALLAGGLALQGRRAATTPAAAPVARPADAATTGDYRWDFGGGVAPVSIPGPWLGACRAGGYECLTGEEIVPGVTPAAPGGDWEQQERTQVAPGVVPVTPLPIAPTGPADEYTNENERPH